DAPYNPQIAELRAFSFDPAPLNLAFGKPVELYDSSDTPVPTWSGFPASRLVDGFLNTISHPLDDFSEGYYYQIDLEAEVAIGEVRLSGRLDGCCPERLSNFLLEILDGASDSVFVEEVPDQVTLPVTVDIGNVTGRYLRIINAGGASYSPQVGEVAVFPPAS